MATTGVDDDKSWLGMGYKWLGVTLVGSALGGETTVEDEAAGTSGTARDDERVTMLGRGVTPVF